MATFEDFQRHVKQAGWVFGLAVGGALFAPLLAAAAGIAPPGFENISLITSLFMLVAMLLAFALLGGTARRRIKRWLAAAAISFVLVFGAYVYLHRVFVVVPEGEKNPVTLGCGLSDVGRAYARDQKLYVPGSECPGPYLELLEDGAATAIWTRESIRDIQSGLLLLWTLAFAALTLVISAFLLTLGRSRAARQVPAAKGPSGG